MLTVSRALLLASVASAMAAAIGMPADLGFIKSLSDGLWTYVLLGVSSIVLEELGPIFAGMAVHEGELRLAKVIIGITTIGWVFTSLMYWAGRTHWDAIRKRFPRLRSAGTVALRVVARNPLSASFLVRFAFGLRIVLPIACGAAKVPLAMYLPVSLLGGVMWAALFTTIGYAAGEAAVRFVGRLDRVTEIVGALVVTSAVFAFIRWNRNRRAKKEARRLRKATATSAP